jgi:hypothetical protein
MKAHQLEIGKYYRKIDNMRSACNIGVVFQVTGTEESCCPIRYCGPVLYDPNGRWRKSSLFYVEEFDTYEEVSDDEATVYRLAG